MTQGGDQTLPASDVAFTPAVKAFQERRGSRAGSGKSGLVSIDAGAQTVLERSAVVLGQELGSDFVEARSPSD